MSRRHELERIAYSLAEFAEATGLSVSAIRKEIEGGRLTPSYYGVKPLVKKAEGQRFIDALPPEKPEK